MTKLRNIFSWSFSAAECFAECRRRRYWAKYAMWDGWNVGATPLQQAAYRLSKIENRYSLAGQAVELAVRWILKRKQQGMAVDAEEAYQAEARPFLLRCWKESQTRAWRKNPKEHCCLHEHYYQTFERGKENEAVVRLREHVKQCIANFVTLVLPRIEGIKPEQEVAVATVAGAHAESFDFEGIKVYAIPDYVCKIGEEWHIYDWKSGHVSEQHDEQMRIYGLWAHIKHGVPPEQCVTSLEYLARGEARGSRLTADDLALASEHIRMSVAEMTEYLQGGDRERNEPLPMEDWELAATRESCRWCGFLELCADELNAAE